MIFFFIGLLFLKVLFGHIYLLPILYILHQYLSPMPLTHFSYPIIIAAIYKQIIYVYNLSTVFYMPLTLIIPYGIYFAYFHPQPNPISENKIIKEYARTLIFEIFKSSYKLIKQTITTPILKTYIIIFPCKLNANMTAVLAGSITSTPGTYTITAKKGFITLNTIEEFDDLLYQHIFFQKKQNKLTNTKKLNTKTPGANHV